MNRSFLRTAVLAWVIVVAVATISLRAHHASPSSIRAMLMLAAAAFGLVWVGAALWSGSIRVGYPSFSRTVRRLESPAEFWLQIAFGAVVTLVAGKLGVSYLIR